MKALITPLLLLTLSLPLACEKKKEVKPDSLSHESVENLIRQVKTGRAFKAVQVLRKRCMREDVAACFGLGKAMEAWKTSGTERASASKWYRKACDLGHKEACMNAALFATTGRWGADINIPLGITLFAKACKKGLTAACSWRTYISALRGGKGANPSSLKELAGMCGKNDQLACAFRGRLLALNSKDPGALKEAREVLLASCKTKNAYGCAYLGEFYRKNKALNEGLTPPEHYLEAGCKGRVPEGCAGIAHIFMAKAGEMKYTQQVLKHFTDACMYGGLRSCARLSKVYYEGKFIPVSYPTALFFATRGCKGGDGEACLLAARIYRYGQGVKPDYTKYQGFLKEACDMKVWAACLSAGRFLLSTPKGGKSGQAALTLFKRGCQNGHMPSCTEEAVYYEGKEPQKARQLHEKVCDKGGLGSCNRLGAMLLADEGALKKKGRLAFKIFQRTCKKEDGDGCYHLARLYEKGIGVGKSKGMARKYTERACKFKSREACGKIAFQKYLPIKWSMSERAINTRIKLLETMQDACDSNAFETCYLLGQIYEKYKSKTLDLSNVEKAEGLYLMACQGRVKEACDGVKRIEKARKGREKAAADQEAAEKAKENKKKKKKK